MGAAKKTGHLAIVPSEFPVGKSCRIAKKAIVANNTLKNVVFVFVLIKVINLLFSF
jgi:hypothetical protein